MIAATGALMFTGYPVALVLAGVGVAFGLLGHVLGMFNLSILGGVHLRLFGNLTESDDLIYAAVPSLIFLGVVLGRSGIAADGLAAVAMLAGRVRGGMGMAVTLLGVILAPAAGVVGASVTTLTHIALPALIKQGYKTDLAAGSIAGAGTLGVIFPPAVILFFLAFALRLYMPFMFLGILGPCAVLFVSYLALHWFLGPALDAPRGRGSRAEAKPLSFGNAVRHIALPGGLMALVVGSVVGGWATPTEAASPGAVGVVLLAAAERRLTPANLYDAALETATTTAMIFFVVIGASVFALVFTGFDGGRAIAQIIGAGRHGGWGTLAMVLALTFVLGCFFDWIEILIIFLPVFAGILGELDFSAHVGDKFLAQIWIGILLALTLQTSFLTPPFGFALFFLKGAAPEIGMGAIYRGVLPFIAVHVLVIAIVAVLPELVTWLPLRVLGEPPGPALRFRE